MNQHVCDPDRLSSFLRGELSADAERDLTSHLDRCESCGNALEQQVAATSAWQEAQEFLSECHGDGQDADWASQTPCDSPIQQVLSQLLPTDDPHSLGRLGEYEVTGAIGHGGMGVVLKAHDPSLDRIVAIKVLAPHLAANGSARQRFAREAKAAATVLHPNVIAIHSVSIQPPLPYLVMPYVKGTSLQKRLDAEGPLPLLDSLRIGAQVAAGLAAAHEQGLVHRDIKPGNILMEQGVERVTLTDFGLARAVDDASLTRSGVIAGTPQYMSPEQARGEAVDQSSDLFSLGSVLYALATGRPPFRAETSFGVLRKISDETPTPIRELNPDVPEWLCAIINRLMAKEKQARFGSSAEVHELLEACLSHAQQPTVMDLPAIPLRPRKRQLLPVFQFFAGAAAMVTIAIGLLYLMGVPSIVSPTPNVVASPPNDSFTKEFVVSFPNPDEVGVLNVDIKRGSIQVRGYDGDKVVVELSVPNDSPDAPRSADGLKELRPNTLDFDIQTSDGQIQVDGNSQDYITNLTIKVPWKTHLILDSYRDGVIQVDQVEGTFVLRSQNNDIRLNDVSGSARIWAYNGDVTASFDSVTKEQPLSFESYNGSIDIALPVGTQADARYRSGTGKVFTDFEIAISPDKLQKRGENTLEFDRFVHGTLNGGGPALTLATENGDIRLRTRQPASIR